MRSQWALQVYSQLEGGSHVVNTAWAMLALLAAGYHKVRQDRVIFNMHNN